MAQGGRNLRRLDELRTLYRTHPQLREVLVEGHGSDVPILRRYIRERGGTSDIEVYAIDSRLEVPAESVLSVGAEVGAKGRLVAVAAEVDTWPQLIPNVTCIVDLDRAALTRQHSYSSLLVTDVGSMDVYFLQERPIGRFLDEYGHSTARPGQIIGTLVPALRELFVVRAALHEVGVGLIRDIRRCCHRNGYTLSVDSRCLVERSLQSARAMYRYDSVYARIQQMRANCADLTLEAVRGHDIAPLLTLFLDLNVTRVGMEALERDMRLCVQPSDLDEQRLFVRLRARLGLD